MMREVTRIRRFIDRNISWDARGGFALARVGFGGAVSNRRAEPFGELLAAHRCVEDGFFCPGGCAGGIHRHEAVDHPTGDGKWRNSLYNRHWDRYRSRP